VRLPIHPRALPQSGFPRSVSRNGGVLLQKVVGQNPLHKEEYEFLECMAEKREDQELFLEALEEDLAS
jgi:hypothetical protein